MTTRKMFSAVSATSAVVALALVVHGAQAPTRTRAYVEALASPRLEGRLTGSAGEQLASDYLVSQLQKIGAKPLPGQTDYRIAFDFTAGSGGGGGCLPLTLPARVPTPRPVSPRARAPA